MSKCRTRYCVVAHVVSKFAELVQNKVARVFGHLVTGVVNFFHVALGTRSTHNVGRVGHPLVEPIESFLRHASRQHSNATTSHNAANGNAASRIVARTWPHCTMACGVELTRNDSWYEARKSGQHLVCRDHGEAVAEGNNNGAFHASESLRQHYIVGHIYPVAVHVVVPMHAKEVASIGRIFVNTSGDACRNC